MAKRAKSRRKNKRNHTPLQAFGALIIAMAGFFSVSGLIANSFYSSVSITDESGRIGSNLAGQASYPVSIFYCGYDSLHDLILCAPSLSSQYAEKTSLNYDATNPLNNRVAIKYDEERTDAEGVNTARAETDIFYDGSAIAFTCQEAENACRQGYQKGCLVRALCNSKS